MKPVRSTTFFAMLLPLAAACGDDSTGTGGSNGTGGAGEATSASGATSTATSTTSTTTIGSSSSGSGDGGGGGSSTSGAGGEGGDGAGGTGGSGGSAIEPRFQALADAVELDLDELDASGAAIAVIEDGEVTFARGFGLRNGDDPVDAETLFRIGSVNKVLTATALLGEVERGNVALDDAITDVVTDFELADPEWAPQIQLGHLLSHTGALSDYLEVTVPSGQRTDAALHDFLVGSTFRQRCYLMAPAGVFYNYSNPNYYLAGLAAETSSGMPYRDVMSTRVFDPLEMGRTFFLADDVLADGNYAVGLTTYPDVPAVVEPDTYENAWARPAGYATSNVLDLAKFVQFLLDGNDEILGDDLRAEMQSAVVSTREYGDLLNYGYGLDVLDGYFVGQEFFDQKLVRHGGDIPGFAADIYFVPDAGVGFVALANADGAHLGHALVEWLDAFVPKPDASEPPDVSVTDGELRAYAGEYEDPFNVGQVVVSVDGDSVRIAMPDLDAAGIPYDDELEHYAEETFILSIQGIQVLISFVEDATYARTRFFVGTRVESEGVASAQNAAPAMTSAERRDRVARMLEIASREPDDVVLPARSK